MGWQFKSAQTRENRTINGLGEVNLMVMDMPVPANTGRCIQIFGVVLFVVALLAYVSMFFDPVTGGEGSLAYLQSMADVRIAKSVVHGLIATAAAANIVGYALVSLWLRRTGPIILIGMLLYFVGNMAIATASFLDGFVAPVIGMVFAAGPVEDADSAFRALKFMGILMTLLAHLGWVLQGGAMLFLASALLLAKRQNMPISPVFILIAIFSGLNCVLAFFFLNIFPQPAVWMIAAATTLGSVLLAGLLFYRIASSSYRGDSKSVSIC